MLPITKRCVCVAAAREGRLTATNVRNLYGVDLLVRARVFGTHLCQQPGVERRELPNDAAALGRRRNCGQGHGADEAVSQ